MKRMVIAVVLCLALGVLVMVMLMHGASLLLEAETRSWATYNTCAIITSYIKENENPRWPTSWDDLAGMTYTTQHPYWPAERAYYQANVAIDFKATLRKVAGMTRQDFDAVQPIGPDNQFQDYQFPPLIDAARDAIATQP